MKYLRIGFLLLSILYVIYILLPSPLFPPPLPNSIKSLEPADLEDPNRVGYFTNLSREEVIAFYQSHFESPHFGIKLPTLRLNYPPEEAKMIIRDQTLSTFLEELVHPMRESLYINGFTPTENDLSPLFADGKWWERKIIIKYVPSLFSGRLLVAAFSLGITYVLIMFYSYKS